MILYLDTSDIVKLYVQEKNSEKIRGLVESCEVITTSIISYAETRAAFARIFREKGIHVKAYRQIIADLDSDWENYFGLNLSEDVVRSAGNLSEKYGLRGFDALHLASALFLKKSSSLTLIFSCSDNRLKKAAQSEGLETGL
ncbi:MAG: type II toxin-antitoxin system VapC family toxin [Candidatus Aminicenantes bacterium]|nr:type II toxin-antitoxin system VapC family toxin [Candidatus Aminicenantes bacterium]